MKSKEIRKIISEEVNRVLEQEQGLVELSRLNEAKLKKGDIIKMQDGEYGVVNKLKGKVAYIKLKSSPGSFHPIEADRTTYKGKHKGKDLYLESLNEARDFVVIDPRGNAKPVGMKAQGAQYVKKMGGPRKGYHLVLSKNAKKARRAVEKHGATSSKTQNLMFDLMYEGPQVAPQKRMEFGVEYVDGKGKPKKDNPLVKRFKTKALADKYAKKGNQIDKVGGKYTVVQVPVQEISEVDYQSKLSRGHKPDHYQLGTSDFKPFNEINEEGKLTEKLARGLKPLLKLGSVITKKVGEDKLLKLSDAFEKLDDERGDDIASDLNMAIEKMQDGYASQATGWLKKFNKECKKALKEGKLNEAEVYKYKKFASKAFKEINDAMFNFRHSMGIKTLTNKDMKLKKKVDSLHQGIFDLQKEMKIKGLTEIESEDNTEFTVKLSHLLDKHVSKGGEIDESLPKFKTPYEAYSWIMNKRGEAMDIEMEMMETSKEIQMAYGEMEQDAEPGGGPKADRYGREIEALENQHKELRAEFNMVMAEIDEYDQNY